MMLISLTQMEMRAWPWTAHAAQIPATACRQRVMTCQRGAGPFLVWRLEKVRRLCGRTAEWSLREDCFRQEPQGPEYYHSPEGGRERRSRRTNENEETHNQEDVNARKPQDKAVIKDNAEYLRTNYSPITSCRERAQGSGTWQMVAVICKLFRFIHFVLNLVLRKHLECVSFYSLRFRYFPELFLYLYFHLLYIQHTCQNTF